MGGGDQYLTRSSAGPNRRTAAGAALCLLLLVGYGVLWSGTVQRSGGAENYVRRVPFRAILTGAALAAGPRPDLLYDPAAQGNAQTALLGPNPDAAPFLPYTDPPFAAVGLAPLARSGAASSTLFTAWAVLTTIATGLAIGTLAGRWTPPGGAPWLLMLATTSFLPLIASLMLGQSTMLALLGWAGLSAGLKTGRDGTAGCAGALAAFAPPVLPFLLLALALARRWRTLATLLGTLALAGAVVTPRLGAGWPLAWGRLLLPGALEPAGLGAALLAAALLVGIWGPRPAAGAPAWLPAAPAWDLRWAATVLAALLGAGPALAGVLALGVIPAWLLASSLGGAHATGGTARRWLAWLWLGYALGPVSALAAATAAVLAPALWVLATIGAILWRLWG